LSATSQPPARATRAIVDLDRIVSNLSAVRSLVGTIRVLPVVKANAYGHGAKPVALALERAGAAGLCVALLEEGLELRRAGVAIPLYVIGPLTADQIRPAIDASLTPAVYRPDLLEPVEAAGRRRGSPAGFHLKLDTGMSRLGILLEQMPAIIERLAASKYLRLEGVFSNFACADCPEDPLNAHQKALFERALRMLSAGGIDPGIRHLANSAALELIPSALYDAVRPGLLIYGIPSADEGSRASVMPALSLLTEVVQVRDAPEGTAVGYGATWRSAGGRQLATVPIGYDDGLMRALSNEAFLLVGGRRAPIVGRISMDLTVLDVTHCGAVEPGDPVVILGRQEDEEITAWEIARRAGTIPWEVLCRIGGRVPRQYVRGGEVVGRWDRWSR
jgi:alanine racemase